MRNIRISDITMKQPPEAGGFSLSFREKIELAKQLDRLGVDVIEVSPIANRRIDTLLVKSLAGAVQRSALALPLNLADGDAAEAAWNAVKEAAHPRLQVSVPVSTVQMEYLCHKKPAQILELIGRATAQCRAYGCEVEFVAEDAGRSEPEFLHSAIAAAVEAGAGIVTLCDTAGTLLPDEFRGAVAAIRASIPEEVTLGVRCSNELFIAESCAMAAIQAGAAEVKTAACGGFTGRLLGSWIERKKIHYVIPHGSRKLPLLTCVGSAIAFAWLELFAPATVVLAFGPHWGRFVARLILVVFALVLYPLVIRKACAKEAAAASFLQAPEAEKV